MSGQTAAAAAATAVAAACTAIAARRALAASPRRPAFVAWTIGFALFTIAAAALWLGAAGGWTDVPFRVYYLTGGILVVAYLAVGELLLVLPGRTVTRLAAATMLFLTFAAVAAVLAARVDGGELARAGATPPNDALEGPWPKVMAIALNSAGTVVLLVGSIASARRRRDPRPLLVAAGVAVIAAASTATRAGSYAAFALGQAAGVTLILLGLVTRRLGPR
jgi:hypothetical protein